MNSERKTLKTELIFKLSFWHLIFILHTVTEAGKPKTGANTKGPLDFINIEAIKVPADYSGPKLEDGKVTLKFMKDWIKYSKEDGAKLHEKYALSILRDLRNYCKTQPSLVEVKVPKKDKVTICGELHGSLQKLHHLFEKGGLPSERNRYVFNGDFKDNMQADKTSIQSVLMLFGFKLLHPEAVLINRGPVDHEQEDKNDFFGLISETYDTEMVDAMWEVFHWLPIAHRINENILTMHSNEIFWGKTFEEIKDVKRGLISHWPSGESWHLKS